MGRADQQDRSAPPDEVGQDRTVAVPGRPLDARVLRTLSLDLLGRPPLSAERATWIGRGLRELLDAWIGSEEFWRAWLEEQLYYFLLIDNFRPAGERIQAIPQELAEGRLDVREALHRLALSSGFDQRNPGADTFVTVVMEQICGIEVQKRPRELEIGKRVYDGGQGQFLGQSGTNQADIVRIAIASRGASQTFAAREHLRYVHEALAEEDLGRWARELHEDPRRFAALLCEAFLSEAYAARLERPERLSNRLFVRALFVDLVDRLPQPDEAEPLREALDGLSDSAPLRSILARLFLDSGRVELPDLATLPDRAAWLSDLFQRLLGRAPTAAECEAFLAATSDPACRAETVVYAIVSHPDYHTY